MYVSQAFSQSSLIKHKFIAYGTTVTQVIGFPLNSTLPLNICFFALNLFLMLFTMNKIHLCNWHLVKIGEPVLCHQGIRCHIAEYAPMFSCCLWKGYPLSCYYRKSKGYLHYIILKKKAWQCVTSQVFLLYNTIQNNMRLKTKLLQLRWYISIG